MGEITKYLYDEDHLKIYDPRGVHRQHYSEVLRVLWVENFSKFFVDFFLFFFAQRGPGSWLPLTQNTTILLALTARVAPKLPALMRRWFYFFSNFDPVWRL